MKIDFKALGFALYNGYPIVYSDTSTYIESGFSLQPPADRPITYGLFIRVFSLNGFSLWTVALMQSLIISFLILLTLLRPKYLIRHIIEAGKSTCMQLISFNAGDGNGSFVGETRLFERIKKYFRFESVEYSLSRQSRGLLTTEKLENENTRYRGIIILSTLLLLLVLYSKNLRNQITTDKKFLIILLTISVFLRLK